eukprot:8703657-Lingulodinium_polyedra.AAC.1
MLPGDVLIVAVGAGGQVAVSAAGERAEVIATTNLWVRIHVPLDAAARAAVAGATEMVYVCALNTVVTAWM